MPQTSIALSPSTAYQGQIAEPGAPHMIRTANAEGAAISAGTLVKRGTDKARQVKAYTTGDVPDVQNFAGVVVLETSRPYEDAPAAVGSSVNVLRMGVVYLSFSGAVTAGQDVLITVATGVLSSQDHGGTPGAGIKLVPGARIVQTTTGAGLAAVEISIFGQG